MPRKITRQEYNSLLKEDRKQDYTATIAAKLGDYEYSKGNPTSSDPETQKKLDNIMKMCNLFKEAANDVKVAPDADKSFVLSSAKIRMKSYESQFFEGKDYITNDRHWQHDVVGDWFWDWSNLSPDFWRGHPELCYYVREVCNDLYLPLPYFANELSVGAAPGAYRDKLTDKVGDPANVDNMVALLAVKDSKDGPSRYQAMFKD